MSRSLYRVSKHSMNECIQFVLFRFLWNGVVGFDIAGDEGTYPLELHKEAISWAVKHRVPVTAHAGCTLTVTISVHTLASFASMLPTVAFGAH
eukprot:scaffold336134_cov32-Prasinocladus_malaysianus.AAC.3